MDIQTIPDEPRFTGRFLVVGKPNSSKSTIKALKDSAGLKITSSLDYEDSGVSAEAMEEGDGVYFNEIGVSVISASEADQLDRIASEGILAAVDDGPNLEPEQYVYALADDFGEYLRGFRDAADAISKRYNSGGQPASRFPAFEDTAAMMPMAANATWGLQKTRTVVSSPLIQDKDGSGIKVCVLDTGMDLNHPDFAGRSITSRSFVPGEAVQDGHSHGTHCIGTACGPETPATGVERYGVAHGCDIFAGKVLSNAGSGQDGWILAGINWAIANKCDVISMSLGAPVAPGDSGFSQAYENAAQAAFNAGSLIIAAAGNDSRNGLRPVGRPANSPSIMAVGALDQNLVRAPFSNVTFHAPHGKVDISGPGVGVFSSVPANMGTHGLKSGTSMATPHVAGIAALHAQANPGVRGAALWQKLTATAEALSGQPVGHVGAGNVQAPYRRAIPQRPWWWWWFFRTFDAEGMASAAAGSKPAAKGSKRKRKS